MRAECTRHSWSSTNPDKECPHCVKANEQLRQLRKDCLTLALRLYGEDDNTFAPETAEVMKRWRPECHKALMSHPLHTTKPAEDGAWTCGKCGFVGFWSGVHCGPGAE
jgi:rubrerythrin